MCCYEVNWWGGSIITCPHYLILVMVFRKPYHSFFAVGFEVEAAIRPTQGRFRPKRPAFAYFESFQASWADDRLRPNRDSALLLK